MSKVFGKLPTGKTLERILQSPNYTQGGFQNLIETTLAFTPQKMYDTIKRRSKAADKSPVKPLPGLRTDLANSNTEKPSVIWFGHSSYLVQIGNKNILVDPVFSKYASPVSFGVRAYPHQVPYGAEDMPNIDIMVLTHDHYDHLDYPTMLKLKDRVGQFVTPLGVGAHLEYWGVEPERIHELDWHESVTIDTFEFTALPSRHFSGRGLKRNQSLWASYALKVPGYNLYLGGDSGYGPHFKSIGDTYGPFDLTILECGQYDVNWSQIHMMPEQTVQASIDLQSKLLLPVHWGKFTLSLHPWYEPITRATAHAEKLNVSIATPMLGEQLTLGNALPNTRWWQQ